MTLVQYTGGKNPEANPQGFVNHLKKRYPGIEPDDIRALYTRAVMNYRPPSAGTVVALFGNDIMTEDVEKMPWWGNLPPQQRKVLLSHPIDGGVVLEGSGREFLTKLRSSGLTRDQISRESLVSLPGLENTYVWCNMNTWVVDVSPHDLDVLLRHKGDKSRQFVSRIQVIDDHGLYEYVRPYSRARTVESFRARTVDEIEAIQRDQSRKDLYHGIDTVKE